MEDINLHFTGDFHAIASAHNLLSAMLDAHVHHGNAHGLDTRRITWPRTIDMNDRALRSIIVGLGGLNAGPTREDRFVIIPGSEIMAIMALASGLDDLEQRCARVIVGLTRDKAPIRASDLKAQGAMTLLLKDAINPNLVQTLEGGPAFIHCGPFGNIAHGCNSVVATKLALALNRFVSDSDAELDAVRQECGAEGVGVELCEVWEKGGEGGVGVAEAVQQLLDGRQARFKPLYDVRRPVSEKIETIAREIYGAEGVDFAAAAERALEQLPALGLGETPICMAKTQYSFSDDPGKLGAPTGFRLLVRDILPSAARRPGAPPPPPPPTVPGGVQGPPPPQR